MGKAPNNDVFYRDQNWSYPKIIRGEGIYLFDDKGRPFIDACAGAAVANIGHGNKEVAAYAKEQMACLAYIHLSRWTAQPIEACAEKTAQWTPGSLNHVFFVSGGSEATEAALKMARQYYVERDGLNTRKHKVITKYHSFHGNTIGALSMTGMEGRRRLYGPLLLDFPHINQFYHYRNPWNCKSLEDTSIKAAGELEAAILKHGAENIAAFISEPVVGAAAPGIHPEKIYFDMVRAICDKYDILLIIDEVMAGFGRTGKNFGSDHYGVQADILTVAKGMSSGYTPMGAAIASDTVFNAIMINGSGRLAHGHTYAGNPLSCGISLKVLEIIEREGYVSNANMQGEYLLKRMQNLLDIPIVGDVRGKGLLLGVELVKDQKSKQPFPAALKAANRLTETALEQGIVLYPGGGTVNGTEGDHFLLSPPLSITREEIDLLYERMERALQLCAQELVHQ
ncbi:MAG: hypothetical protein B0D92_01330 [Spirochaeta sp. LUC14_002_19_P3]|nr:MAG: hypothetical protein B0D92_01330 [Spirochaeta sp. LUC14_002_19_P3]